MADAVDRPTPPAHGGEPALARPRPTPNVPRHRFGVAYLALAGILGVAVGLFVVLVARGGKDSSPSWSAWQPTQSGVPRLNEIAKHVSGQYVLPGGRQIVGAYSSPPVVRFQGQLAQARAIAISTGLPGETARDAAFVDAGNVWTYELCGFGKSCTIATGKSSIERGKLLQREALELSLYTLRFESAIDYVLTYFPPVPGKTPVAVFLRRQDLKQPLARPLAETLRTLRKPLAVGQLTQSDNAAINRYVLRRGYAYASDTLQDGSPLLVLTPLTA